LLQPEKSSIFRKGQTTAIYAATPHWFQSKKLMTGVGCTPEVDIAVTYYFYAALQ
jgi:hypothetical protein